MSAIKPLKAKGTAGDIPSDLSGHHPQSFASRMAKVPLKQERERVVRPMPPNVAREVAKSVDNKAPLKSKSARKESDKGSPQSAALSDAADRSKGRPREFLVDLSGHHPLSFASRKAMMDANRDPIPERQAAGVSSRKVVLPNSCPSAVPPQDLVPTVDVESPPKTNDVFDLEPLRQFRHPAPVRVPASVVLAASRSFAGAVSDARSAVKLIEFEDLCDSIGFVAELCDVEDDNIENGGPSTEEDSRLTVRRSGLQRASRGKPSRPSSQTWSEIHDGERAKRADVNNGQGATSDGCDGPDQNRDSVEFGFIPMVLVVEAGSQLAMELAKDSESESDLETTNMSIRLEMCESPSRSGSPNGQREN